jgi:hypothetical protein
MSQLLQSIAVTGNIDANLINRNFKLEKLAKFNEMKLEHPKMKQVDICRLIGTSDSTLKRIRKDLNVSSPYRFDIKEKHTVNLSNNEILLLSKKLEEEEDSILKQEKLNVLNEYIANKEKKAKQLQEMKDSKKITLQDLKKEV